MSLHRCIKFESNSELLDFNHREAINRDCDGEDTAYWYQSRELFLVIDDDLPKHTQDYELTEIEFPQPEEL